MLFDGMFVKNDMLGTAMQAAVVRNDVINNNIANAETPGYKKKEVRFETYFQNALNDYMKGGSFDFKSVEPSILIEHSAYNYRIDENNVDIESEMVDLYQNSVKYDVMAGGIINNYKRLNLAISGIR